MTGDFLKIYLQNSLATQQLGKILGESLQAGSVVLLDGDLGAGKTTLIQGMGVGLGIQDAIVSPTFTLINEYSEGRIPLYHLDLYRLDTGDVEAIAPEIYWEGKEVEPGITAIEWAQRLSYYPPNYVKIQLVNLGESGREAIIQNFGNDDFSWETLKRLLPL